MNRTDFTPSHLGLAAKEESKAASQHHLGVPAGSHILTSAGELPIEYIGAGDKAITRDCGMSLIKAIEPVEFRGPIVRLLAGTLGQAYPDKDILLPADQLILLRDWRAKMLFGSDEIMVPVHRLVDGEFVTLIENGEITLFQMELAAGQIVYADGLETAISPPNT